MGRLVGDSSNSGAFWFDHACCRIVLIVDSQIKRVCASKHEYKNQLDRRYPLLVFDTTRVHAASMWDTHKITKYFQKQTGNNLCIASAEIDDKTIARFDITGSSCVAIFSHVCGVMCSVDYTTVWKCIIKTKKQFGLFQATHSAQSHGETNDVV